MDDDRETSRPARPSRRTLARGAAWTVPVIAVGAAAPAMAASGSTGSITAACGSSSGSFTLSISRALIQQVRVEIVGSGTGSATFDVPSGWVGGPTGALSATYTVNVVNRSASGTVRIALSGLDNKDTATLTATISAVSGEEIIGTRTASFTIRRQGSGNSNNYFCTAT